LPAALAGLLDGLAVVEAVTNIVLVFFSVEVERLLVGVGVVELELEVVVPDPLMLNGLLYWNIVVFASRINWSPYTASVPRVGSTAQSYLPAEISTLVAISALGIRVTLVVPANRLMVAVPLKVGLCVHWMVYVEPAGTTSSFAGFVMASKPVVACASAVAAKAKTEEMTRNFMAIASWGGF